MNPMTISVIGFFYVPKYISEEVIKCLRTKSSVLLQEVFIKVPKEIQAACWLLVDNVISENIMEVDYLQIFELKKDHEGNIVIVHRQEEPTYQKKHKLKFERNLLKITTQKLWIIDDGINQIMLLPEEY